MQGHADDVEADGVSGRIAEEIEGVRLQRLRPRESARRHLNDEHSAVDGDDDPQCPLECGGNAVELGILSAATCTHTLLL